MNIIYAYLYNPISSVNSKNIQIKQNSISCTSTPFRISSGTNIPEIAVLVNNNQEYSGKASPGSEIYIYEDNTNCTNCNPVNLYTRLIADAAGTWKIFGDFTGKKWVYNATHATRKRQPAFAYFIPC